MKKDIRIKRPKDKEEVINRLMKKKTNKYGVFDHYYQVMTFAASIGIRYKGDRQNNGYVEFTDSSEPVNIGYFNHDFIDMIVIKHKNDARYLDWEEDEDIINEKIKIFEAYINGGLGIIEDRIHSSTNILEDITQLVLKELSSERKMDVNSILSEYND